MADEPASTDQRIADALARLGAVARSHAQAESFADSLTPLQARALVTLLHRGELRIGDVARELLVTYGTVSAALSSLVEKDLVTKRQDPTEHRAVLVELTRRGRSAAARAAGWAAHSLAPALGHLGAAEAATFLSILLKLIFALERAGVIGQTRMCLTCQHFVANGGDTERPHRCNLLRAPIGGADLRLECPEHEPAGEAQRDRAWQSFAATDAPPPPRA